MVAAAAAASGDLNDHNLQSHAGHRQQQGVYTGGQGASDYAAAGAAMPSDLAQLGYGPDEAAAAAAVADELGDGDGDGDGDDAYIVECPCGIQFDDGHLMIECEHCRCWAHTACLQAQMVRRDIQLPRPCVQAFCSCCYKHRMLPHRVHFKLCLLSCAVPGCAVLR